MRSAGDQRSRSMLSTIARSGSTPAMPLCALLMAPLRLGGRCGGRAYSGHAKQEGRGAPRASVFSSTSCALRRFHAHRPKRAMPRVAQPGARAVPSVRVRLAFSSRNNCRLAHQALGQHTSGHTRTHENTRDTDRSRVSRAVRRERHADLRAAARSCPIAPDQTQRRAPRRRHGPSPSWSVAAARSCPLALSEPGGERSTPAYWSSRQPRTWLLSRLHRPPTRAMQSSQSSAPPSALGATDALPSAPWRSHSRQRRRSPPNSAALRRSAPI
jgi:hypothetical protein